VSKIWQALKEAELRREPAVAAASPSAGKGLSATQRKAVQALLAHGSVGAAAEACGVSAATLEGWLKTPEFVAAYHIASRVARSRR
jgi:hypothetical protein